MRIHLALLLLAGMAPAAAAQDFPLHVIRFEGAERYPQEALGALTGLRVGEAVNPQHFNEGARRLAESGFVSGAQFRYEPAEVDGKAGYAVIFQVNEVSEVARPLLDIPGHAEADLWKALKERDPLLTPEMPRTPGAEARYLAALADVVAASGSPRPELEVAIEGDMVTGKTAEVIIPKNLPLVSAVRVEGTKVLAAQKAVAALESVALGQPVTERRFRRYAVENVTPLLEELGHLKTAYPRIEMAPSGAGVLVTLHCEEGMEYQLGAVELTGEQVDAAALAATGDLPVGKTANWKKVLEGLDRVRDEFRKYGYLNARLRVTRNLDDVAARADVAVAIERGTQFAMGELMLPGLDEKEEAKARKRWKLAAGEPLNALYVNEFLKEAFGVLEGATGVSQQFARRGESNVMDVVVTFRK